MPKERSEDSHFIRPANSRDHLDLQSLYKSVSEGSAGLARRPNEITSGFITELMAKTKRSGLMLVIEDPERQQLVGAIHAVHGELECLRHVMGQLTILIHPAFQKMGLGRKLFSHFLKEVEGRFHFIKRVELRAFACNECALQLYEDLGFVREGRFHGRILAASGEYIDGIAMAWTNPGWRDSLSHLQLQSRARA